MRFIIVLSAVVAGCLAASDIDQVRDRYQRLKRQYLAQQRGQPNWSRMYGYPYNTPPQIDIPKSELQNSIVILENPKEAPCYGRGCENSNVFPSPCSQPPCGQQELSHFHCRQQPCPQMPCMAAPCPPPPCMTAPCPLSPCISAPCPSPPCTSTPCPRPSCKPTESCTTPSTSTTSTSTTSTSTTSTSTTTPSTTSTSTTTTTSTFKPIIDDSNDTIPCQEPSCNCSCIQAPCYCYKMPCPQPCQLRYTWQSDMMCGSGCYCSSSPYGYMPAYQTCYGALGGYPGSMASYPDSFVPYLRLRNNPGPVYAHSRPIGVHSVHSGTHQPSMNHRDQYPLSAYPSLMNPSSRQMSSSHPSQMQRYSGWPYEGGMNKHNPYSG